MTLSAHHRHYSHRGPSTAWTTTHGFFIIMGGFHYFDGDRPLHPLSRREVERLVARGKLVPPLEDEIKATSKAGTVSKAYAILQTLWFVTQCIARPLQRLPITEFEVVTLAYTIMIIGMYGFWWSKPFGTERPIAIQKCISGVSRLPMRLPIAANPLRSCSRRHRSIHTLPIDGCSGGCSG